MPEAQSITRAFSYELAVTTTCDISKMVKEKTVLLRDLPVLPCAFSWDTDILQARIKEHKPDYDPKDLWTWPQLRSPQHPGYHENRPDPITLPRGIAYCRDIALDFISLDKVIMIKHHQHWNTGVGWIRYDNLLFPFTYDGSGQLRSEDVLSARDRWNWVHKVTGIHPKHLEVEVEEKVEQPESTTEAFLEVLKMIKKAPEKDMIEFDELRKESSQLKTLLANQRERADRAEEEVKAANEAHNKKISKVSGHMNCVIKGYEQRLLVTEGKLNHVIAAMQVTKEDLQQKTAECEEVRKRETWCAEQIKQSAEVLKDKDRQLKAAQQESATTKEQMMKIWAEMRKAKDGEDRKRKARGETAEPEMKKTRI